MTTFAHPITQQTIDGGYSGDVTITVAASGSDADPMVFLESDLLASMYPLTAEQAVAMAAALTAAAAEILPPHSWDLEAFAATFERPAPKEHSRTQADLQRYVRELSERNQTQQ